MATPRKGAVNVVFVYAFDISMWPASWSRVDNHIFDYLEGKLIVPGVDNRLGYVACYSARSNSYGYVMLKHNHTTRFNRREGKCTEEMAWGLRKANELISQEGAPGSNGSIILLFSDGRMRPPGNFFLGEENYKSPVPVHTFTLHEKANANILRKIAENSSGGRFHPDPVPQRLSESFKQLLDSILNEAMTIQQDPVQKLGPWGGNGGTLCEIQQPADQLPKRLESVTVYAASGVIQSIAFSYTDQAGHQNRTVAPWGGDKGKTMWQPIVFGSSETVKEIFGATGDYGGRTIVKSLTIVTDANTYGPYGKISWGNTQFHVAAPDNHSIVGFYGRADAVAVDQIGAYVRPN